MRQDFNFKRALELKQQKNWDYIYVAIDLHGTIMPERKSKDGVFSFFPHAKKALQLMSQREDLRLILFTGSKKSYVNKFLKYAKENQIHFDFANENPDAMKSSRESFCAKSKLYYNVLLDDRAGFEPGDWKYLYEFFKTNKLYK